MASEEILTFNTPHAPHENAIQAFTHVLQTIKQEIIKSRHHWDKHEPRMYSRAQGVSDHDLVNFTLENDLVLVSSASTTYGTIILGKIRLPAINDSDGEGYIHVRIHDPPNRGTEDVTFHSLFTEEGPRNADDHPSFYNAIQTKDKPLTFFNE